LPRGHRARAAVVKKVDRDIFRVEQKTLLCADASLASRCPRVVAGSASSYLDAERFDDCAHKMTP